MTTQEVGGPNRRMTELERQSSEHEEALFSARMLAEAQHPKNQGAMLEPNAHAIVRGPCGDTMEISLRLRRSQIQAAAFMTDGCKPAVACGSVLTTMVQGMTLEEAGKIEPQDVIAALDGLPTESAHCATLAVTTLREAITSHRQGDSTGRK